MKAAKMQAHIYRAGEAQGSMGHFEFFWPGEVKCPIGWKIMSPRQTWSSVKWQTENLCALMVNNLASLCLTSWLHLVGSMYTLTPFFAGVSEVYELRNIIQRLWFRLLFTGFHLSGEICPPKTPVPQGMLDIERKYKVSVSFDRWEYDKADLYFFIEKDSHKQNRGGDAFWDSGITLIILYMGHCFFLPRHCPLFFSKFRLGMSLICPLFFWNFGEHPLFFLEILTAYCKNFPLV